MCLVRCKVREHGCPRPHSEESLVISKLLWSQFDINFVLRKFMCLSRLAMAIRSHPESVP